MIKVPSGPGARWSRDDEHPCAHPPFRSPDGSEVARRARAGIEALRPADRTL